MSFSPFKKPHEERLEAWAQKREGGRMRVQIVVSFAFEREGRGGVQLNAMSEILEQWLNCQVQVPVDLCKHWKWCTSRSLISLHLLHYLTLQCVVQCVVMRHLMPLCAYYTMSDTGVPTPILVSPHYTVSQHLPWHLRPPPPPDTGTDMLHRTTSATGCIWS
eukprot:3934745-Rhodomonas_salina.3